MSLMDQTSGGETVCSRIRFCLSSFSGKLLLKAQSSSSCIRGLASWSFFDTIKWVFARHLTSGGAGAGGVRCSWAATD